MTASPVQTLIRGNKLKVIVTAAGRGERLRGITNRDKNTMALAKTMVPVGPYRALDYSLRSLVRLGVTEADLCLGYLAETATRFRGRLPFDLKLNYLFEDDFVPRHTTGSIVQAVHQKGYDANDRNVVLVIYGDVVHDLSFEPILEAHLKNKSDVTVVVNPVPRDRLSNSANLRLEGMPIRENFSSSQQFEDALGAWIIDHKSCVVKIQEMKRRGAVASLYSGLELSSFFIFKAAFLREIKPLVTDKSGEPALDGSHAGEGVRFSGFGEIFEWLTTFSSGRKHDFRAYILPPQAYRRDIGSPESLIQANLDVLEGKLDAGIDIFRRTDIPPEKRIYCGPNTHISPEARIIGPALISQGVVVGPGAYIERSVVREGNWIGAGDQIKESVLFPQRTRQTIKDHSTLERVLYAGGEVASFNREAIIYPTVNGTEFEPLESQVRKKTIPALINLRRATFRIIPELKFEISERIPKPTERIDEFMALYPGKYRYDIKSQNLYISGVMTGAEKQVLQLCLGWQEENNEIVERLFKRSQDLEELLIPKAGFIIYADEKVTLALTAAHAVQGWIRQLKGIDYWAEIYNKKRIKFRLLTANAHPDDLALLLLPTIRVGEKLPALPLRIDLPKASTEVTCLGFQSENDHTKIDYLEGSIFEKPDQGIIRVRPKLRADRSFVGGPLIYGGQALGLINSFETFPDDMWICRAAACLMQGPHSRTIVKYLKNWGEGKKGQGDFMPQAIPPLLRKILSRLAEIE